MNTKAMWRVWSISTDDGESVAVIGPYDEVSARVLAREMGLGTYRLKVEEITEPAVLRTVPLDGRIRGKRVA